MNCFFCQSHTNYQNLCQLCPSPEITEVKTTDYYYNDVKVGLAGSFVYKDKYQIVILYDPAITYTTIQKKTEYGYWLNILNLKGLLLTPQNIQDKLTLYLLMS